MLRLPCTLTHFVLLVFQFPESLIFRPVIHTVPTFPVSSSSESDSRMELTMLWPGLPSQADPCAETMLEACPHRESCSNSVGSLKECISRLAQVSKTHFPNVKWPLMTRLLINCSVPGSLEGEAEAKFSVCCHLSLSQKAHCQAEAAVERGRNDCSFSQPPSSAKILLQILYSQRNSLGIWKFFIEVPGRAPPSSFLPPQPPCQLWDTGVASADFHLCQSSPSHISLHSVAAASF